MANITVRNIPDTIFEKIRMLSEIDRRSLNNELLIVIESGIRILEDARESREFRVTSETQSALWEEIAGKWKDTRSKESLIKEIYESRTFGRDFSL